MRPGVIRRVCAPIGVSIACLVLLLAIGCEGDTDLDQVAHKVLYIPDVPPIYSPIPISVLLQLLAYYTAKKRGCSIDKPKNLAKSVTVD